MKEQLQSLLQLFRPTPVKHEGVPALAIELPPPPKGSVRKASDMKKQLQSLLQHLNQGLVQREAVIKPVLLATLAGENPVLVGPPGTGKSLIARRIAQCFPNEGAEQDAYFEYLLTKFSTPEEIFGPLSISELKQDRFKRNTAGYLPSVRVAFLDEVFKASSSILNALLTILNERVYHNGAQVQRVPLQALIAASNELPTDHEELSALYDRFLLRVFVDYVGLEQLPALFTHTTEPDIPASLRLTAKQLAAINSAADAVRISDDIVKAVQQIWAEHQAAFKEDARERLSDRRLKKLIHLMRVSAATNGRDAVDFSDVLLLKDSLWNHPDNREKVMELLRQVLDSYNQIIPLPAGQAAPSAKQPAVAALSASPKNKGKGQMNAVVKGYKGRGTEDDPLLIESVEDLVDLARPEVGQNGYFFLQTCDIIVPEGYLPNIKFSGNYDGAGFHLNAPAKSEYDNLFTIVDNSYFKDFMFDGGFSRLILNSTFKNCRINSELLGKENFSDINEDAKIKMENCEVASMQNFLFATIERCIVRKVGNIRAGEISLSQIDSLLLSSSRKGNLKMENVRVLESLDDYTPTSKFMVNIINSTCNGFPLSLSDERRRVRYSPLIPAMRTQRYFEHTLGFDFENIWRWDDAQKAPVLRHVGLNAKAKKNNQAEQTADAGSTDLLSQQTQANIWL